jgi:predicted metalloprotease with PDZ domain
MMKKFMTIIATVAFLTLSMGPGYAGEEKDKDEKSKLKKKKMHEKEIKNEIGYFAMKLLDMSGEDQLTLSQEPFAKPFLGVCSEITKVGVNLPCITPGHKAAAAGLLTGDRVIELNGIDLVSNDTTRVKKDYYNVLMNMQTGDVLTMKIMRGAKEMEFKPTVGKLMQPGYELVIYRKARQ